MRRRLDRAALRELMRALARSAPRRGSYRVFLVGGGTAVLLGFRDATVDADLYCARNEVFRSIQEIKERLRLNVELVRPEDFVPPVEGTDGRHVFIETISNVAFYHYDPYAQMLAKIVRGFRKDLEDAENFVARGLVDAERFRALVHAVPESEYRRYPALSRPSVLDAVDAFLKRLGTRRGD